VSNTVINPRTGLLALPRLTVRRSTGMPTFEQIVQGRNVPMIYLKDRALTKGWAMARRARAGLGSVSHGE
jgi:hypothetical protein